MAQTESEPETTPGRVDSGILEGGVSVALLDRAKDVEETGISSPEDYWTPLRPPPSKGEYKDQYGSLSPVPQHDGTECLKTDDTLWSHADHFKVQSSAAAHADLAVATLLTAQPADRCTRSARKVLVPSTLSSTKKRQ